MCSTLNCREFLFMFPLDIPVWQKTLLKSLIQQKKSKPYELFLQHLCLYKITNEQMFFVFFLINNNMLRIFIL